MQAELLEGLDAVQWRVWIALLIGQSNRYFEAGLDEVRVLPDARNTLTGKLHFTFWLSRGGSSSRWGIETVRILLY